MSTRLPSTSSKDWFDTSWAKRKIQIQDFVESLVSSLKDGWLDDGIAALWILDDSRLGMAQWNTGGVAHDTLFLSEVLEVCDEREVKAVVIHEISHLISREHNHGDKWRAVCEEISQEYPELRGAVFSEAHSFSEAELVRLNEWKSKRSEYPFIGECSRGHIFYRKESPVEVNVCVNCESNSDILVDSIHSLIVRWRSLSGLYSLSEAYVNSAKSLNVEYLAIA